MKKTFFAAAALVAMVSCNKTLIETPESEFGYIDLGISADTEMSVTTKATVDQTTLNSYYVTLMKEGENNSQDTNVWGSAKQLTSISENDKKVQAGSYYIVVENKTAADCHPNNEVGEKHIYAKGEAVPLTAGGTAVLSAAASVINSKVTVDYTELFSNTFEGATVAVSLAGDTNGRSYTFNSSNKGHDDTKAAYFPADTKTSDSDQYFASLSMTINAKVANVDKTYTISTTVNRATWAKVTLDSGVDGTITITITADDAMTEMEHPQVITIDPVSGTVINPAQGA